jgi:hypothetical protein
LTPARHGTNSAPWLLSQLPAACTVVCPRGCQCDHGARSPRREWLPFIAPLRAAGPAPKKAPRKKRKLSAAGRANIIAALKKRWAMRRNEEAQAQAAVKGGPRRKASRSLRYKPSRCLTRSRATTATHRKRGAYSPMNHNSTHPNEMRHPGGGASLVTGRRSPAFADG